MFDLQKSMNRVHEFANSKQSNGFSRTKIFTIVATTIYGEIFSSTKPGAAHKKRVIRNISKQLAREQIAIDKRYAEELLSINEIVPDDELELVFGPNPLDADAAPIVIGHRSLRNLEFDDLVERFPILPQGLSSKAREDVFGPQDDPLRPVKGRTTRKP